MVQHVTSEQLAFTLQQVHQDWSRIPVLPSPRQRLLECHEEQIKLSFADVHRKVFTVDEDLHEQNGQQLASELREESFDFKPHSPFVDDASKFNEIATPRLSVRAGASLLSLRTTLEPEHASWFVNVTSNK